MSSLRGGMEGEGKNTLSEPGRYKEAGGDVKSPWLRYTAPRNASRKHERISEIRTDCRDAQRN